MRTTPYSLAYKPPAPVLPVILIPPGEGIDGSSYPALVDTGADGTFVPASILESLDLPVVQMVNVRSHLGEMIQRAALHKVDLILFESIRLPNIDVVCDDWGENIILGRNVLNKLRITLDGPSTTTRLVE